MHGPINEPAGFFKDAPKDAPVFSKWVRYIEGYVFLGHGSTATSLFAPVHAHAPELYRPRRPKYVHRVAQSLEKTRGDSL